MKPLDIFWSSVYQLCQKNYLCFDPSWMVWNIFLALTPCFFGWLMIRQRSKYLANIWFLFWLFLMPNTVYILSDIKHLHHNLNTFQQLYQRIFYFGLYTLFLPIGVITYLQSMRFLHIFLHQKKIVQKTQYHIMSFLNILFAFGVTLGRFQRSNSWEIITNPLLVVQDSIAVILRTKSLLYFILFALLIHLIFILFEKYIFIKTQTNLHLNKRSPV